MKRIDLLLVLVGTVTILAAAGILTGSYALPADAHPGHAQKKIFPSRWYQQVSGGDYASWMTLSTSQHLNTDSCLFPAACESEWLTPANQGLSDWNAQQTTVDIQVKSTDSISWDINVYVDDLVLGDPSILGLATAYDSTYTYCSLSSSCTIFYGWVDVSYLAHSGAYDSDNSRRATLAHELGHLLSLKHESVNSNESIHYECGMDDAGTIPYSIMSYDCIDPVSLGGLGIYQIQPWDACGVNHAYFDPGVGYAGCVLFTPSPTPSKTASPTPSKTPSPTPSHTPSPTPTHTPSSTHSPTATASSSPAGSAFNFKWYLNKLPVTDTSECDTSKPVPPNVPMNAGLCSSNDLTIPNGTYDVEFVLRREGVIVADETFPSEHLFTGTDWHKTFAPPAPGGTYKLQIFVDGTKIGESTVVVPGPTGTPATTHTPSPTPTPTQAVTTTPTASPAIGPTTPGNVNCDNRIDGEDVTMVLFNAGGLSVASDCLSNGDVDGNQKIDGFDALLILKYWAGLIHNFPIG